MCFFLNLMSAGPHTLRASLKPGAASKGPCVQEVCVCVCVCVRARLCLCLHMHLPAMAKSSLVFCYSCKENQSREASKFLRIF